VTTQSETDASTEIERLRAERDALHAEVHGLRRRARHRGWLRRTVAALLVALACVVLVAAVIGIWARRNFLDTGRFVDRAGPQIEEPAVQQALAARLTEQLMVLVDPEALFQEALPERARYSPSRWRTPSRASSATRWRPSWRQSSSSGSGSGRSKSRTRRRCGNPERWMEARAMKNIPGRIAGRPRG
jgi:hypothetical protein